VMRAQKKQKDWCTITAWLHRPCKANICTTLALEPAEDLR
jgi:hypothetical protein